MKKFIIIILFLLTSKAFSQWEMLNYSIVPPYTYSFQLIGDRLFAGTIYNLLWSDDLGDSWHIDESKNYFGVFSFAQIDDIYFCISNTEQVVAYTTDFGVTWSNSIYEGKAGGYINVAKVFKDRLFVIELYKGIQYTSDLGMTWVNVTSEMVTSHNAYSMEIMEDTLFIGGQGGLYRTTDLGLTWENVGFNHDQINEVKVNDKKIYLGTWSNGLQVSEDFGTTWNKIDIDPTITNISSIEFIKNPKNDSTILFIGTEGNYPMGLETAGIYMSLDLGKTWQKRSDGFTYKSFFIPRTTDFYLADKYLFVGSVGGTMYRALLQDLIDGTDVQEFSQTSGALLFPNPATDFITIDLSNVILRVNPWVEGQEIRIFDIFGERVLSTPSLRATPQKGNFEIDVSILTPGIYFLKLNNQPPVKFIKL